jgi:hypothetical protein
MKGKIRPSLVTRVEEASTRTLSREQRLTNQRRCFQMASRSDLTTITLVAATGVGHTTEGAAGTTTTVLGGLITEATRQTSMIPASLAGTATIENTSLEAATPSTEVPSMAAIIKIANTKAATHPSSSIVKADTVATITRASSSTTPSRCSCGKSKSIPVQRTPRRPSTSLSRAWTRKACSFRRSIMSGQPHLGLLKNLWRPSSLAATST